MDEKTQNQHVSANGEDRETSQHPANGTEPLSSASGSGKTADEIQNLRTELEKARKDHLYLMAEFDNYKRNMIKERSDLRKYGSERLLTDLLNVLDIFDTALSSDVNAANVASFKKGMEMTAAELRSVLNRFGVEEIAAEGKPFDPSVHEAISSEATEQVPEGHVVKVFKKPFKLHDRVIRPGQVVVAKKP